MPKRSSSLKKNGKLPLDLASTGKEFESTLAGGNKNPAAVALGHLGGLKGGNARAKKLSPERRKEIAKIAANARWKKHKGKK